MSELRILIRDTRYICFFLLILMMMTPAGALIILPDGTEMSRSEIPDLHPSPIMSSTPVPWKFFYKHDCQSCEQAREYLKAFEKKNPQVPITHYNLAYPEENRDLFTGEKSRFNTTKIKYPALFVGDVVLSGSSDIIHGAQPLARVSGYDRTSLT